MVAISKPLRSLKRVIKSCSLIDHFWDGLLVRGEGVKLSVLLDFAFEFQYNKLYFAL